MDERAVSTVVDVALGLLLVSAAVTTMGWFLLGDDQPVNEASAEQTAETLSSSTISVEYHVRPVRTHAAFDERPYGTYDYERVAHGTAAELLARGAVRNVTFQTPAGERRLTRVTANYSERVDGAVRSRITGARENARVVAVWRPFEASNVSGRVTAGPQPPADAETSVTTMTVPSGMDSLSDAEVEAAYASNGRTGVAELVARTVVQGYFPPIETQVALQDENVAGAMTRYRYRRAKTLLDATGHHVVYPDGPDGHSVVSRRGAQAYRANDAVVAALAALIDAELAAKYPGATPAELADVVTTGEVVLVVTTW
jgi:hypothetical protein